MSDIWTKAGAGGHVGVEGKHHARGKNGPRVYTDREDGAPAKFSVFTSAAVSLFYRLLLSPTWVPKCSPLSEDQRLLAVNVSDSKSLATVQPTFGLCRRYHNSVLFPGREDREKASCYSSFAGTDADIATITASICKSLQLQVRRETKILTTFPGWRQNLLIQNAAIDISWTLRFQALTGVRVGLAIMAERGLDVYAVAQGLEDDAVAFAQAQERVHLITVASFVLQLEAGSEPDGLEADIDGIALGVLHAERAAEVQVTFGGDGAAAQGDGECSRHGAHRHAETRNQRLEQHVARAQFRARVWADVARGSVETGDASSGTHAR